MQILCIHCGNSILISSEHLGGVGQCPHCQGEIQLPSANEPVEERDGGFVSWVDGSLSGLVSLVFNMGLILLLALLTYGGGGLAGEGEEVLLGSLPSPTLTDNQEQSLSTDTAVEQQSAESLDDSLQIEEPTDTLDPLALQTFDISPSASGGSSGDFDIGRPSSAAGGAGGSFDGMVQQLRASGLDIVITFDSTGSMGGEIDVVKSQIKSIGGALIKLVPKARIGLCTYRDTGEEYEAIGLPLTGDIQAIDTWLSDIRAAGGGDHPEAVEAGLAWAIEKNSFRSTAKKVILLFGDAPPHSGKLRDCLRLASDFHGQGQGVVSTVTCRSSAKMPEFVEIAQMGGGEAFLTTDQRQIMTELMVLVFGSKFRSKVVEAFELIKE
ncbi:vWA domain-containing protein [Lignipirellula cremea]|uniref:von Willebrand factor type A domain protein n=1 Tax=Lignipirellula cremea TaxID=2528010 RepID=A0A518E3J0_9BACT|nr:vWA domain-containing protein [Lignipirellula cremea]QDU98658.1 von Willebrand factor type A domain protein [Lignipirellula cremea]